MEGSKILWFGISFISGETIALLVFYFIRKKYEKNNKTPAISILKGLLERFSILLGLVALIPTIIVFFSAVKLGTRLKENQESKISNDYFLIGNIISMIIAIGEFLIYQKIVT